MTQPQPKLAYYPKQRPPERLSLTVSARARLFDLADIAQWYRSQGFVIESLSQLNARLTESFAARVRADPDFAPVTSVTGALQALQSLGCYPPMTRGIQRALKQELTPSPSTASPQPRTQPPSPADQTQDKGEPQS